MVDKDIVTDYENLYRAYKKAKNLLCYIRIQELLKTT